MKIIKIIIVLVFVFSSMFSKAQEVEKEARIYKIENGQYVETCEVEVNGYRYYLDGNTLYIVLIKDSKTKGAEESVGFKFDWDGLTDCARSGLANRNCNKLFPNDIQLVIEDNHAHFELENVMFTNIGSVDVPIGSSWYIFFDCISKVCPTI